MRVALILVSLLVLVALVVVMSGTVGPPGPTPGDPHMPVMYPHPMHAP